MKPKLVIFDCDGVLVDSEGVTAGFLAEALTEAGWPVSKQEFLDHYTGGTLKGIAQTVGEKIDLPSDWVEQTYVGLFKALESTKPIPHIEVVLEALAKSGTPFCIGSNGPKPKMDVTLKASGLAHWFVKGVFSAHDFPAPKPSPIMFLHAAEYYQTLPVETVVVGDTRNDALAAQAANMRCYGYAVETAPKVFKDLGAEPFYDMRELPALLDL